MFVSLFTGAEMGTRTVEITRVSELFSISSKSWHLWLKLLILVAFLRIKIALFMFAVGCWMYAWVMGPACVRRSVSVEPIFSLFHESNDQLLLYPECRPLQVAPIANVVLFCFVLGTKWCTWYQHCRRERKSIRRYPHLHCYDSSQWCGCTYPKTQSE